MPAEYEAIRDALRRRGKPSTSAKRIAAATYNARHPGRPMGPHTDMNGAVRMKMRQHMAQRSAS